MNSMRRTQKLQQNEIRSNFNGLGKNIFKHAEDIGIILDFNMEEIIKHFLTIIITAVGQYSMGKLKGYEADIILSMKAILDNGGMKHICCCNHLPSIHLSDMLTSQLSIK